MVPLLRHMCRGTMSEVSQGQAGATLEGGRVAHVQILQSCVQHDKKIRTALTRLAENTRLCQSQSNPTRRVHQTTWPARLNKMVFQRWQEQTLHVNKQCTSAYSWKVSIIDAWQEKEYPQSLYQTEASHFSYSTKRKHNRNTKTSTDETELTKSFQSKWSLCQALTLPLCGGTFCWT